MFFYRGAERCRTSTRSKKVCYPDVYVPHGKRTADPRCQGEPETKYDVIHRWILHSLKGGAAVKGWIANLRFSQISFKTALKSFRPCTGAPFDVTIQITLHISFQFLLLYILKLTRLFLSPASVGFGKVMFSHVYVHQTPVGADQLPSPAVQTPGRDPPVPFQNASWRYTSSGHARWFSCWSKHSSFLYTFLHSNGIRGFPTKNEKQNAANVVNFVYFVQKLGPEECEPYPESDSTKTFTGEEYKFHNATAFLNQITVQRYIMQP